MGAETQQTRLGVGGQGPWGRWRQTWRGRGRGRGVTWRSGEAVGRDSAGAPSGEGVWHSRPVQAGEWGHRLPVGCWWGVALH